MAPYSEYTLANDDDKDVSFYGELVASVSNKDPSGPRSSRWTELELYRTQAGTLICHRICNTRWAGESSSYETEVVADEKEVIAFFGLRNLAKELYSDAEIDCTRRVD